MSMEKKENNLLHSNTISLIEDRRLIELLISFQDQTNKLLEEVVWDNRILKKEISDFRDMIIKYEIIKKELDDCIHERRECQRKIENKFNELTQKASCGMEETIERSEDNRSYIVSEVGKLSDKVNEQISKIKEELGIVKVDAAKQGAKYGVIVSIAVFIIMTLITLGVHWVEKKLMVP